MIYEYTFEDGSTMELDLRARSYPDVPRWARIHLPLYELALQTLDPLPPIHDVGCGSGYGTRLMAAEAGSDVDVEFARRRYPDLDFHQIDWGTKVRRFQDTNAVAIEVIEHVENDLTFAKNMRHMTKGGYKLFLSTPEKTPDRELPPYHVREYTEAELRALLFRAGFTKIERLRCSEFMESIVVVAS